MLNEGLINEMDEQHFNDIQQRFADLRQDRSKFFTVSDVMSIYRDFKQAVDSFSPSDLARLRQSILDCFLIFSLAFNTVGFTKQPIAVYAKAVTLTTVIQFIRWDPSFTPKEQMLLKSSIESVRESLNEEDDGGIPRVNILVIEIERHSNELEHHFGRLSEIMKTLPEQDYPLYSQITHLRRQVLSEIVSKEFKQDRYETLKSKLDKIRGFMEGRDADITSVNDLDNTSSRRRFSQHSQLLKYQLNKALTLVDTFKSGVSYDEMDKEDPELRQVFDTLSEILPILEVFVMTRRWTLRVTDLYQHIKVLLRLVPQLRVGLPQSNFDEDFEKLSNPVEESSKYRYLLTFMTRKSWAQVFKLLDTMEPVSEALYALYNQLLTMKRCLGEVRLAGGISNLRELYPYQLKLASLDNLRVDGKFVVGDEIPPGQGVLNGILAECFETVYELKLDLEKEGNEAEESIYVEDDVDDDGFTSNRSIDIRPLKTADLVDLIGIHADDHFANAPDSAE